MKAFEAYDSYVNQLLVTDATREQVLLTVESLAGELERPLLLVSHDELNPLLLLLLLKASWVELRERAS